MLLKNMTNAKKFFTLQNKILKIVGQDLILFRNKRFYFQTEYYSGEVKLNADLPENYNVFLKSIDNDIKDLVLEKLKAKNEVRVDIAENRITFVDITENIHLGAFYAVPDDFPPEPKRAIHMGVSAIHSTKETFTGDSFVNYRLDLSSFNMKNVTSILFPVEIYNFISSSTKFTLTIMEKEDCLLVSVKFLDNRDDIVYLDRVSFKIKV